MGAALIVRLRRARESTVSLGEITVTVRRPTDLEMFELGGVAKQRTLLTDFVSGWAGATELALGLPGGTGAPVDWDPLLWAEWIQDRPEHWKAIIDAIMAAYRRHETTVRDRLGKSMPGSSN